MVSRLWPSGVSSSSTRGGTTGCTVRPVTGCCWASGPAATGTTARGLPRECPGRADNAGDHDQCHDGHSRRSLAARPDGDPDGMFGLPADLAESAVTSGEPAFIAEHLAALGDAGAQRAVVAFAAGDRFRQVDLLADAVRIMDGERSS